MGWSASMKVGQLLLSVLHWWHQAAGGPQNMDTVRCQELDKTRAWAALCKRFNEIFCTTLPEPGAVKPLIRGNMSL